MTAPLEWHRRGELGRFTAHWATAKRLIRAPRASFEGERGEGGVAGAFAFAAISYAYVIVPSMVFLYVAAMTKTFGQTGLALIATFAYGGGGFALLMLQLPMISAVEWLALRALGQRQATFSRAVEAHAYAEAAMVLGLLPVIGAPMATCWAIGLRVFAIRRLQKVPDTFRAVIAVAAPVLCLCVLMAAVVVLLLG